MPGGHPEIWSEERAIRKLSNHLDLREETKVLKARPGAEMKCTAAPAASRGKIIAESGGRVEIRDMLRLYAPFQEPEPYSGILVERDVAYGPDARHRADIFQPNRPSTGPVVVFVHGGGYIAGDRRLREGSPFYDNVALWAARKGFVGVTISYRLAPAATWPAAIQDVARAVCWVNANFPHQHAGSGKVFLLGHSAGATHVAGYAAHPGFWHGGSPGIAGAVLLSATFVPEIAVIPPPDAVPFVEHERAYFGAEPRRDQASLEGLCVSSVPLLIAVAEHDPPFFRRHFAELQRRFNETARDNWLVEVVGHNHMSQILSFNSVDDGLAGIVAAFIERYC